VQRQKTETVTVQKPSAETTAPNAPSGSNVPRVIAGGRGGQLKAVTDFEAKYRNLTTHEMGIIVDYDGNIIRDEITGNRDSISLYRNKEERMVSRRAGNHVATHNHPDCDVSFSPADIINTIDANRAEFRAITPKYNHVIQRPENGFDDKLFQYKRIYDEQNGGYKKDTDLGTRTIDGGIRVDIEDDWNNLTDKYIREYLQDPKNREKILSGQLTEKEIIAAANEYSVHLANVDLAKKYGWNYERVEIKK
jgi:hypothetical protein